MCYKFNISSNLPPVPRNYDPELHPFAAPREYTRAMNAVKLGRMFAKPFVGSLDGHGDSVTCLSKHPSRLSQLYTGAADGEVRNVAGRGGGGGGAECAAGGGGGAQLTGDIPAN